MFVEQEATLIHRMDSVNGSLFEVFCLQVAGRNWRGRKRGMT